MTSTLILTSDLAAKLGLKEGDSFKDLCVSGTVTSDSENGISCEVTSAQKDDDEDAGEGEDEGAEAPEGETDTDQSPASKLLKSEQE